MSLQMTFGAMLNVTSLQESEDGPMPCASQAGPTTDPSGPEVVRANLSARQAKRAGLLTSGTCGPPGSGSLASAALTSSLASRLHRRLACRGSILFALTWKASTTPAGRSIYRLRASARRTSDSDCGSWPTCLARDVRGVRKDEEAYREAMRRTNGLDLPTAARMIGWPTPRNAERNDYQTKRALRWLTVTGAARLVFGPPLTGSCVETASSGRLNPEHSRWLMGFPPEWDACAPTATPSSRKSRRK